jgi:DNA-binding transcriptional MocR family regulator
MRDLVGHDRSPAAYLVYLNLWVETESGARRFAASYETLAANTGLSKRTAQAAVAHLLARGLIVARRPYVTAVSEYRVRKPWARAPARERTRR